MFVVWVLGPAPVRHNATNGALTTLMEIYLPTAGVLEPRGTRQCLAAQRPVVRLDEVGERERQFEFDLVQIAHRRRGTARLAAHALARRLKMCMACAGSGTVAARWVDRRLSADRCCALLLVLPALAGGPLSQRRGGAACRRQRTGAEIDSQGTFLRLAT